MFLSVLIQLIFGYLKIKISCPFPERLINLVNLRGFSVWGIRILNENTFIMNIALRNFKKLRPLLRKTGARIHILSKKGLPFVFYKYRKRSGLLLGGIGFLVIVFLMSGFVWSIEISGNNNISDEQILLALNQSGFYEGAFKSNLNLRSVRQKVRVLIPEISFIELNLQGSKAYVKITESKKTPEIINKSAPQNLVAARAGVIEKIEVTAGEPVVFPGDTVREGQLLVSGIIDSEQAGYFLIHSTGRVFASSQYELKVFYPYKCEVYQRTGNFTQKKRLKIFNFYINLYLRGGIEYPVCDKIVKREEARIGNYVLPLSLETETCYEKVVTKTETPKERCKELACLLLEETSAYEFANKEVTASEITVVCKEAGCEATGNYIVTENIAKELLID